MNALRRPLAQRPDAERCQRRWPVLFVVLLALCSLVLTACAVDIETDQDVGAYGKGTRSIVVAAGKASNTPSNSPLRKPKIKEHGFRQIVPLIENRADGYRLAVVYRLDGEGEDAEKARERWIDSTMPEDARKVKSTITIGLGREEAAVVMDAKDDAELQPRYVLCWGTRTLRSVSQSWQSRLDRLHAATSTRLRRTARTSAEVGQSWCYLRTYRLPALG
ncbi:hypothetical protein [Arthrobacter sp. HMSC08H08]|uniref:hypothetical protein n=1 Tax=Arthrobacter sp. HMSC08H08 TaxID=1581143 RepID=UPI0008A620A9|nr:hypothetical protein [Arthrobacter sp. HMSC08H08]OFT23509.1 hypothetical protein HMPREF3175_04140 [Arthrobacter sp. HMSC08H08]